MAFLGHSAEAGITIKPKIITKTAVTNTHFFNIQYLQSVLVSATFSFLPCFSPFEIPMADFSAGHCPGNHYDGSQQGLVKVNSKPDASEGYIKQ
jgi:hypothetical protein